ncbi:hypothetical protein JFQ85_000582 [Aeromonas hydrophila]|nr:hypothetical protein [Aeromonas hydrophila]HAT1507975.1 hypothetical protein [Aeromonas hydrophila]HAT1518236.1 hypothetical protein [Aeromonas hydrophila]HAT1524828.1 hypothetical protein [Aeromonas hydrophila]
MTARLNGVDLKIINKLNEPCFVDYLWYRTCQINNITLSNTPSKSMLLEELEKIIRSISAQDFMRESDVRSDAPLNLERWIKTLYKEFEIHCLTEKDFEWFDKNNIRFNYFIWRLMSHLKVETHKESGLTFTKYTFIYEPVISPNDNIKTFTGINYDKCSCEIGKNDIINIINRVLCDKAQKEQLVNVIFNHIKLITNNNEITNWLRSDKKSKVQWLSNYLESNQQDYIHLVLKNSTYHADDLLSFFDLLSIINNDRYKLLINNFKKAWNQKTYRDKNKEKKQYSIVMSKDIGDLLDKLSYIENKNKNDIVETLIRRAYAEKF